MQKFRSTAAWQRKRKEILARDCFVCRWCLEMKHKLTKDNLQVHHIVPIVKNDSLKLEDRNLITVCPDCHEQIENEKDFIPLLMNLASNPPTIGTSFL